MDLKEMAEEHKKAFESECSAITKSSYNGVSRLKDQQAMLNTQSVDNRFNCDKMNKAFDDIFGGGK